MGPWSKEMKQNKGNQGKHPADATGKSRTLHRKKTGSKATRVLIAPSRVWNSNIVRLPRHGCRLAQLNSPASGNQINDRDN
jgi:hypothetical protein